MRKKWGDARSGLAPLWGGGLLAWGAEARDAGKHPITHRAGPAMKNDPAQMFIVSRLGNPMLVKRLMFQNVLETWTGLLSPGDCLAL